MYFELTLNSCLSTNNSHRRHHGVLMHVVKLKSIFYVLRRSNFICKCALVSTKIAHAQLSICIAYFCEFSLNTRIEYLSIYMDFRFEIRVQEVII